MNLTLVPTPIVRSRETTQINSSAETIGWIWLDMNDRTLVIVMVNGIGPHLTKRAHLTDLKHAPHRSGLYSGDFTARRKIVPSLCDIFATQTAIAFD
jgi:hypothetical protein